LDISTSSDTHRIKELAWTSFCRSNGGIFLCKLPKSGFMVEVKANAFNAFYAFSAFHATLVFYEFQGKAMPHCKRLIFFKPPPYRFTGQGRF
jgi:hypothetical protein